MNGLLLKALREAWLLTLICGAGACLFEFIGAYVLFSFGDEILTVFVEMPIVQNMLSAMLGTEVGGDAGAATLSLAAWVHPILLALVWIHAIVLGTRMPAAEADRGTIDLLLSLPVSRRQVFAAETLVLLGAGAVIVALTFLGNWLGFALAAPRNGGQVPSAAALLPVAVNLFFFYAAGAGLFLFFSSLFARRGPAVGCAVAVVTWSVLLSFLGQFWEPAGNIEFLGLLHYYRPLAVVRAAGFPLLSCGVLLGVGAVAWVAGLEVFARRDIPAT